MRVARRIFDARGLYARPNGEATPFKYKIETLRRDELARHEYNLASISGLKNYRVSLD
jgi:hypothetical protein